jgi:Beta-propeller repeat
MTRHHCVAVLAVVVGATVILVLEHSSLSAQTGSWLVQWPGLDVLGVAADGHGGAYAAGFGINRDGDSELFVRRVNAAGSEMWTDHFRPDDPDPSVRPFDAAATADGVVVVGGGTDAFIRRYDATGRVLWTRQFGTPGEDHANDVAVAPNGNIYVSGYLGGGFLQFADAFVRQYDAFGNEGWTQQFGEPGFSNSARGLAVAPDETIFAMSVSTLFGPFRQERPFFSAFDRFGTQLLSRQMNHVGISAAASADSVFVAGQSPCVAAICVPTGRGTLSRYDRSGIELWTLDPGLYRPVGGVDVDDSGNAYIAGFSSVFRPRPGSADRLTVLSFDPNGIERLRFRFDEPGGEFVRQVDIGPAGEVFVGGTGFAGFLAKIDVNSPALRVSIDIRPGSAVNPINLSSNGVVPVAIVSTGSFDATAVVATSVCFGDRDSAAQRNCTEAHGHGHVEDADGDGDLDLVLHFEIARSGIDRGDTSACLTGQTSDGTVVTGCDAIIIR